MQELQEQMLFDEQREASAPFLSEHWQLVEDMRSAHSVIRSPFSQVSQVVLIHVHADTNYQLLKHPGKRPIAHDAAIEIATHTVI
jgi:HD-like signal output (HDOD) protein